MRAWPLAVLTAIWLTGVAPGQEKFLPPAEKVPLPPEGPRPVIPAPPPAPVVPTTAPLAPDCGCPVEHKTSYQLHWLEREFLAPVTTMTVREVTTPDMKPTLELEFQKERQVRTEMVLKPRECYKEVTICTQKPTLTTDPCTHCPVITYEPVTETKLVKEIVYDLVPEEKVVVVQTAILNPVVKPITVKTLVLDTKTEVVTRRERIGVLVPVEITEKKLPCPPPGCAR